MNRTGQRFAFGFMDSLLAEVAGVPQAALHLDVDAICRAYGAVRRVAARLGVEAPVPRLAGFAYNHVSTLGAKVTFQPGSPEPHVAPCIRSLVDIDNLHEPEDYLSSGIVPQRLDLMEALRQRWPGAQVFVGHEYQGPITTAALLMGQDFFTLPYDEPECARHLLDFCVRSALNYARAIRWRLGQPIGPRRVAMPDDFAGMFGPDTFAEFVLPYWERMYAEQEATARYLHCEMLRENHLPFLKVLRIDEYDPSVDQYLPPETLQRACSVPYTLRIWPSEVHACSATVLVARYRHLARFHPVHISFHLDCLANEAKIAALLDVARELA